MLWQARNEWVNEQINELANTQMHAYLHECGGAQYATYLKYIVCPRHHARRSKCRDNSWTYLVVQWLRIRLPMQGTRVRSLVREDPTCHGATKPARHNCWACAPEPVHCNYWAHTPQLLKPVHSRACILQLLSPRAATTEAHAPRAHAPQQEKPPQWEAHAPQRRVTPTRRN